jgi:hypothetical protein
MVEKQEGIVLIADPRRNRAAQFYASALDSSLWFDDLRDGSKVVHVV